MVYAGNIEYNLLLLEYYASISKYETHDYKISTIAREEYCWVCSFLEKHFSKTIDLMEIKYEKLMFFK